MNRTGEHRDAVPADSDSQTEAAAVRLQAVVPQVVAGIAAARLDPGAGHKTYSGKDTSTLTMTAQDSLNNDLPNEISSISQGRYIYSTPFILWTAGELYL